MVGADLARVQKAPSRNLLRRYSPLAPPSPARLLRRSYCYDGGANMTAERWPPSREGMEFDTGLMFVGFRRDRGSRWRGGGRTQRLFAAAA